MANEVNTTMATEAELASRLRLAVMRLGRRLRRQAGGDLTPSQMSALSSVERTGPLTLGELSAVEGVRPPTLTKVVAALEEQGLVARHTDPSDRRVARVEVTAAGSSLLARSRSRTDAYLARHVASLAPEDRQALARAVALVEALLEQDE
ncbi:MAG TPA: MarR family transcriptional regulator [Acidimicrobiales bacterium]|jgi:DNA-binding MarR family transcriptional regulator|nr:MarR family transcriptional regulator [Acidimicrobiales bacterium]